MPGEVDLYNNAYANYETDLYREIRVATYGADLGQTSWVTAQESNEIPQLLGLTPTSYVLEIGCGSGRYALQVAETVGCRVLGVDINGPGIRNAIQLAAVRDRPVPVRFQQCDVSRELPFGGAIFDAAFANDVLCHVPGRLQVLRELSRVLKPGGRLLFSDALIIGGMVTHEEIALRSSIGYYIFTPPGENERLLAQAGLCLLRVSDTTENAAGIAHRWQDARAKKREALVAAEGEATFDGLQRFLSCVATLTSERRLLRYVYLAEKGA